MSRFECRHAEHHGDDEWEEVGAFSPESAARVFAEMMDGKDCELFVRPDHDEAVILVRQPGAAAHETFVVGFDYHKSFRARPGVKT